MKPVILRMKHVIVIRHGDLPKVLEMCPLYNCALNNEGVTDCGTLACRRCGCSPLFHYARDDGHTEAVCQVCGARRVVV